MKTINKRPRKLMRARNNNRVNRIKNQVIKSCSMVLFIIRLGLEEQNTAEKLLARLRLHIQKLTGNTNFAVTDPTLAELQTMADDLEVDIDAIAAGNKALISHRNGLEEDAMEMIRQLSYNIQFLSHGDETKIKSAGFDVRKPKGPSQTPGQIMNLVATPAGPGKIKLKWDKEDNAVLYAIEQGSNPMPGGPLQWNAVGKSRNISIVLEGLTPGQLYYFRVFGTNGEADGNPSDPAEQRSL